MLFILFLCLKINKKFFVLAFSKALKQKSPNKIEAFFDSIP